MPARFEDHSATVKKAPSGNLSRSPKNPIANCPLTAAIATIGGKWKLIIIYWLAKEPMHFAELRRSVGRVSQKVLTQQLRELEADGLISRTVTGPVPSKVIYALTTYGRSARPLVKQICSWGDSHLALRQD